MTTTVVPSKPVEATWFPDETYQNKHIVNLLKIFAILVGGLGFIWYSFTTVTRAPFPSFELETWSPTSVPTLSFPLSFQIHVEQPDWGALLMTKLQTHRFSNTGSIELKPVFYLQKADSIPTTNWTLADLPNVVLPKVGEENPEHLTYHVALIPGAELGIYISEQLPLAIYILYPSDAKLDQIQDLVVHGIKETLSFLSDHEKDVFEVDYNLRYQVLFTALHGIPPSSENPLGSPLAQTVEDIFMPTVRSLQPLSQFEVASQAQYFAPLAITPKKMLGYEGAASWYAVEPDMQSLFINSAWDLASVSSAPDLHFLIFVPPPELTPLHLVDQAGRQVSSNSFIVPQWGGVVIINSDQAGNITISQVRDAVAIHLKHFRDLFGLISPEFETDPTIKVKSSPLGVSPLAFDRYRLRQVARFSRDTTTSLYGLRHLISSIPAMEVSYDSMKSVKKSISDLISARELLSVGRLSSGLSLFNRAFLSTEASFFNPKMVAKMYFPPDAAYAIFLPLLLPAVLPLIMTTVKYIRRIKKARK